MRNTILLMKPPRVLHVALVLGLAGLLAACAGTIKRHHEPESWALPATLMASDWAEILEEAPGNGPSWFDVLDAGPSALKARLALIDSARATLDAQYFLWHDDASGCLLMERVLAAADRGVRVRLLLDDIFLSETEEIDLAIASHPNVSLRIFNPYKVRSSNALMRLMENLNDFERVDHRMHNKLMVADNEVAIFGGRNIGDEYFGFGEQRNFRDMDLLTVGEIVPDLSTEFDRYWNSGWAFPIAEIAPRHLRAAELAEVRARLHAKAARLSPWRTWLSPTGDDWHEEWITWLRATVPGTAVVVEDDPDIKHPPEQVAKRLLEVTESARKEITIITAYLVPSDSFLEAIRSWRARGLRVRVITNSLATNNHVSAHTGYRHHRHELLDAGTTLHETRPDAAARVHHEASGRTAEVFGLHGKVLVVDQHLSFIGTFNVDPRSSFLNTEMAVLVESPELARIVRRDFDPDFAPDSCWRVERTSGNQLRWVAGDQVLNRQPAGSPWQRLGDLILGMLPIEQEL